MPRYIIQSQSDLKNQDSHWASQHSSIMDRRVLTEFGNATDIEAVDGRDLFYITLLEKEAKSKEEKGYFLRQLDDNINYQKRKTAINSSYVQILFLAFLGLFIVEQIGILPSLLLLSGQIAYISIAALTLVVVLLASWHCIQKITKKDNAGLYLLTLSVIWISFLFSVAVLIYPSIFLSIGILPLFSLTLATISSLSILDYYNALAVDTMLKKWCDMANTKIASLAFQRFELHSKQKSNIPAKRIKFEDINEENILKIEPDMAIPVDGVLVANPQKDASEDTPPEAWEIDEAVITGESLPQKRTLGNELKGGSKNKSSKPLYLKTRQSGKAVLRKRITNFNRYNKQEGSKSQAGHYTAFLFTALLLLGITATVLLWFFLGPAPVLTYILLQSLAVLNCFSPTSVALAQMLPLYLSRGRLFENNILMTDDALKEMHAITIAIFDKTGTLTGDPSVSQCRFIESKDLKNSEILRLVASAQNLYQDKSTYARAFCAHANQDWYHLATEDEKAKGKVRGVSAKVDEKEVLCGSLDYIAYFYPKLQIDAADAPSDKTVSFVVIDGVYCGWVSFESNARPDAKATITELQDRGITVMMLTGDSNQQVADKVAKETGIIAEGEEEKSIREKVHYGNQEKAKFIKELKLKHPKAHILMVGDGMNDGEALQAAHVGLSISDVADAVDSAVGSLRGRLFDINTLIRISVKINSHIRSNVWSLLLTTFLSMVIAAGITYPMLGFLLAPTLASIVGSVISLFSVGVLVYNCYKLYMFLDEEFAAKSAGALPPRLENSLTSPTPIPNALPSSQPPARPLSQPVLLSPQGLSAVPRMRLDPTKP